jgi:hypothetical protein
MTIEARAVIHFFHLMDTHDEHMPAEPERIYGLLSM